jgi:hypothetical protein
MPENRPIREWLLEYGYGDVAGLIEQVMNGWKLKGTKTRRNWWDVLAGNKNGTPKSIEGISFPVLRAAQVRKGIPVTDNALCRNKTEIIPGVVVNGRWAKKDVAPDPED